MTLIHNKHIGRLVQLLADENDPDQDVRLLADLPNWKSYIDLDCPWWDMEDSIVEYYVEPGHCGLLVDTAFDPKARVYLRYCKVLLPDMASTHMGFSDINPPIPAGLYWVRMANVKLIDEA